jgi:putative tryptophan/tyrosine transport system substrate-binding protein
MKRRDFLTFLGASAAAWPLAASAQQPRIPVIGFVHSGSSDGFQDFVQAFRQGLSETGHVEGRNVAIEYRWADGQIDRIPELVADLVRRRVNLVVATGGGTGARAVSAASATIPILFQTAGDPVQAGLVASLNRPGGNLTGVTVLTNDLVPKRLELLHEVVPNVTTIAVLLNPKNNPNAGSPSSDLQEAARAFGWQLRVVHASNDRELAAVFASLGKQGAGGLMIPPDSLFLDRRAQLGALSLRHGIPAIHSYREFVTAGGLMSYGGILADAGRIIGNYAGRILKGEKPADLPVQQATRIELIINMKTAKAFGLTFPLTLLGRADEVIE